jgi:DNA excision repair protein ERCC-8
MFLSAGMDDCVKVWDTNALEVVCEFSFPGNVNATAMSPLPGARTALVAGACSNSAVLLCDLVSSGQTHMLCAHRGPVLAVQWSPSNESHLFTAGQDGSVFVWDIRRAQGPLASLDERNTAGGTHKFRLGEALADTDRPPDLIVHRQQQQRKRIKVESDPTGHGAGAGAGVVRGSASGGGGAGAGACRGSVSRSSSGGSGGGSILNSQQRKYGYDPTGASHCAHDGAVNGMTFTHDNSYLITTGSDSRMRLWDLNTGYNTLVNYPCVVNRNLTGVTLSASAHGGAGTSAKRATGAGHGGGGGHSGTGTIYHPNGTTVGVYDLVSGRQTRELKGHMDVVTCALVHPSDDLLFTAGRDHNILCWRSDWPSFTPQEYRRGDGGGSGVQGVDDSDGDDWSD